MMPEALLQNSMRLVEVDLSRNGFSGTIPFLLKCAYLVEFVIYQSRNSTII